MGSSQSVEACSKQLLVVHKLSKRLLKTTYTTLSLRPTLIKTWYQDRAEGVCFSLFGTTLFDPIDLLLKGMHCLK